MVQCYLDLSFLLYQRTTEIRRLRYSQILERERLIHFEPTKTAKSSGAEIDIPITAALEAVLSRARSLAKIKPGPGGDAFVIQTRGGALYRVRIGARLIARSRAGRGRGWPASDLAKDLSLRRNARRRRLLIEQLKAGLAHTTITTMGLCSAAHHTGERDRADTAAAPAESEEFGTTGRIRDG
jgi:integrase